MNNGNSVDHHGSDGSQIREAIEAVYAAFAKYPLRSCFEERCSPLGDRRELARRLCVTPLRNLNIEPLAVYCVKALLTMGDAADFKHFLPRILELAATDDRWQSYETNMSEKLDELEWQRWSEEEVQALEFWFAVAGK